MLETHELIIAGRYRLVRRLRRGGMSEVFLATDEQTQQQVALKLVSNDQPDCFKRLKREVRMLRKLSHKHILPILDNGEWEGYAFLVMPYIQHGNLRDLLAQGPLNQEEAATILSQVASALQCAHEHGIVHRDIKASNILLGDIEEEYTAYLADFGLAKAPGEGSDITLTGYLIGTPEYMAPELVTMPESVSSDIYALGILLYQMLTGQLPFTGASPIAICMKHVQQTPLPPSSLNSMISPEVDAVILRAIDKDPARRFPDVQRMAEQYEQALLLSRQSSSRVLSNPLPLPLVRVFKPVQHPTASIAFKQQKRYPRANSVKSKGLLTLVALLWIICTISLGCIVGFAGSQPGAVASISVHSVAKAVTPIQPARVDPPRQPTPSVAPMLAARHPQPTPSVPAPQHKHHKHGHGDDGGDGGGDN